MNQVEVNIVDTETLQSRIKAFLNALVGGVRELARDLPKSTDDGDQRLAETPVCGPSVTHEDLGPTEVHQTAVYPLQRIPRRDTP